MGCGAGWPPVRSAASRSSEILTMRTGRRGVKGTGQCGGTCSQGRQAWRTRDRELGHWVFTKGARLRSEGQLAPNGGDEL